MTNGKVVLALVEADMEELFGSRDFMPEAQNLGRARAEALAKIDEIDTAEEERVADELRNFFLRTLDKHHGFHSFYSPDDDEP